jgi:hypothetical protein
VYAYEAHEDAGDGDEDRGDEREARSARARQVAHGRES